MRVPAAIWHMVGSWCRDTRKHRILLIVGSDNWVGGGSESSGLGGSGISHVPTYIHTLSWRKSNWIVELISCCTSPSWLDMDWSVRKRWIESDARASGMPGRGRRCDDEEQHQQLHSLDVTLIDMGDAFGGEQAFRLWLGMTWMDAIELCDRKLFWCWEVIRQNRNLRSR